ncbi:Hemerythrin HHE cation binding domain-containing protein [Raineyella antarctica]|uniref:Hemerythrin HHE cation binding domain-containing protein n=1 Tax=Raineyella antarctica TaxID=1577474 RepID=A0A1G6GDN2_9ACTN|nr:hemerythrin domain-containing protein [Raineyella antarctica]SDB80019.1 Hemerythrin HHE cation binding domain-containing protein [Raineyella antarctica]
MKLTVFHKEPRMADTRNMGVVHSAMRRDLVRIRLLLDDPSADEPATREALGSHFEWFLDFLEHHHKAEDKWLWPFFRERGEVALADAMAAEHEDVNPRMTALRAAAASYRKGQATPAVLSAAVRALQDALAPHLAHEEEVAMPVMARLVTHKEALKFEKEGALKGRSIREIGWDANWILDGTSDDQRQQFLQGVPLLARLLVFDRYAKTYRADRDALWGGTAAADVPALTPSQLAAQDA